MQRAIHSESSGAWPAENPAASVTLTYDDRHRRRMRLTTDGGEAILLDLEKATLLRDGDGLRLEDASWVRVAAAPEDVVAVYGAPARETARLAWHLGNRHLPVQTRRGDRLLLSRLHDGLRRGSGLCALCMGGGRRERLDGKARHQTDQ